MPEPVTFKRFLQLTGRALTLRCPHCGQGGGTSLFRSWWTTKPKCPFCGFALDRGEPDFWIGGYAVNLVVAEFIVTLILITVTAVRWPDVPWTFLQWGGAFLAVAMPLLFFPVSRLLWLAWDYCFRPVRD
jgi:uncharacterized protein (DUF983 family)